MLGLPRRSEQVLRRRPPHAVLLAMLLAAAVLAGCGPSSGHLEVVALASAPDQTTDEKTARIAQVVRVKARGAGAEVTELQGEGLFDFVGQRGDITFTVGAQSVRTLVDGATVYQSFPDLESMLGGKKWLKLELGKLMERAGVSGANTLFQGQSSDPGMSLDYLRSVGDVTEVGTETVRDVRTTHYRGTVDMARAARRAPPEQRKVIEELARLTGISSVPVDAWIDSASRVRRLRQTVDYSQASSTPQLSADFLPQEIELTMELFDFGVPFEFALPAPEEVVDGLELLDQLPGVSDSIDPGDNESDTVDPEITDPDMTDPGTGPDFSMPDEEEAPNPAAEALVSRLLRTVPPGYVLQTPEDSDAGPIDIEEAADNDDDDDGRAALDSAGFVAGYLRSWGGSSSPTPNDQIDEGDELFKGVLVLVYEFRSSDGARSYGSRLIRQAGEDLTGSFPVDGVPGARGLAGEDEDGPPTKVVVMGRGNYLAAVVVYGADADTPDMVTELAQQQYRLLAD